ncbi:MAG: hypothetical protein ACRDNK_07035 [Solirubrobacteraceae bacterium]
MRAITHLYAGVPVTDLEASIDFETYSNGVRHVKIPDPDGNAIAFAEPPDPA